MIMRYGIAMFVTLCVFPLLVSCKSKDASKDNESDLYTNDSVSVEDREPFDADSAYNFVAAQVDFGPRTPGSKAHEDCRKWIIEKIGFYGFQVDVQSFDGKDYFNNNVKGYNILTRINPDIKDRVLLLAHYDSRQVSDNDAISENKHVAVLGADDGASGVAVLMEILRTVANYPHRYDSTGMDILFVDLEDNGHTNNNGKDDDNWCLGSKHYATVVKDSPIKPRYGILLDMVGAKGARFCMEQYSKIYAARYQKSIWDTAKRLGYENYFLGKDGGAITDDHVPMITIAGIPTVDIINFDPDTDKGFGSHWHTQKDNMGVIDTNTLRAVGETVLTFIKKPL